jgi:hypothetical protein
MKSVEHYNHKPDNSIIDRDIDEIIHYLDSFSIQFRNPARYSVDYLTTLLFSSVPGWVKALLNLRDFLVRPFGLKTGLIPEQESIDLSIYYNIGDRAIFFPVIDRSESEIVMAENDRHLYFRTSLFFEKTSVEGLEKVYLTTLVKYHNMSGKLYFMPVKPFHRLIMRSLLKQFANRFDVKNDVRN